MKPGIVPTASGMTSRRRSASHSAHSPPCSLRASIPANAAFEAISSGATIGAAWRVAIASESRPCRPSSRLTPRTGPIAASASSRP
ncbi:MAG: hypothetical protein ABI317_01600, partial [Gaiellales bacterium]